MLGYDADEEIACGCARPFSYGHKASAGVVSIRESWQPDTRENPFRTLEHSLQFLIGQGTSREHRIRMAKVQPAEPDTGPVADKIDQYSPKSQKMQTPGETHGPYK